MENENGYVYVIECDGRYKIGKTTNFSSRFVEYTKLFAEPITIFYEQVCNYCEVEKDLHRMFKHKNVRGEWFLLDGKDLVDIKKYININKVLQQREIKTVKKYPDLTSTIKENKSKQYVKAFTNEIELIKSLKHSPATFFALCVLKLHLQKGTNLVVKGNRKYKCTDLANDLGTTRQNAGLHLQKLKKIKAIAEIKTANGIFWAINPRYYIYGDKIPKAIYELFENKGN